MILHSDEWLTTSDCEKDNTIEVSKTNAQNRVYCKWDNECVHHLYFWNLVKIWHKSKTCKPIEDVNIAIHI